MMDEYKRWIGIGVSIVGLLPWAGGVELRLPASPEPMGFSCPVQGEAVATAGQVYVMDMPGPDDPLFETAPLVAESGLVKNSVGALVGQVPSIAERGQWPLEPVDGVPGRFRFEPVGDGSLKVWDGDQPVFVYNHGQITNDAVPAADSRRTRGCYIHPVWGPDGEVLTDDFPVDHYHHHGVFWTWPHVQVGGKEYDLWMVGDIEQRFVTWLHRQAGPAAAVIGVENGWYIGERKVMEERVWIRTYPASGNGRYIDLDFYFTPLEETTLRGAEGKSYGGLTVRFAPAPDNSKRIMVPSGLTPGDLTETRLAWADFTGQFMEEPKFSGITVMIDPEHPDFPPTWLTRYYGALCVGWPGVKGRTFPVGETFSLRYRLWVHSGGVSPAGMAGRFKAYGAGLAGPRAQ
ncbi:MAG: PmoA family protein [Verrucomicrobiota bacterium]|jgi:hypothetical protein|nr:PmoA family protein [Verrucomicrobiota bacterium]